MTISANLTGDIENTSGDIEISNLTKELHLLGEIRAYDGNIKISNTGMKH